MKPQGLPAFFELEDVFQDQFFGPSREGIAPGRQIPCLRVMFVFAVEQIHRVPFQEAEELERLSG